MPDAYGGLPKGWWNDRDAFERELNEHGGVTEMARVHGGPGASLSVLKVRRAAFGVELPTSQPKKPPPRQPKGERAPTPEPARLELAGDEGVLVTEPGPYNLGAIDDLLRSRGLDPDDWTIERVLVNDWQAYAGRDEGSNEPRVVTLYQLKAWIKRRVPLEWVFPARDVAERHVPGPPLSRNSCDARLVWVGGDHQAPYQDDALHAATLAWLHDVRPGELVLTGDTLDLPTISRHRDRPLWAAPVQECIDAGFRILSDYRDAAPDARIRKLRGNHDWRLESELLGRAERMFGITPAQVPGEAPEPMALSIRRLLHLDRLGVELAGIEGDDWRFGEVELAPGVVVRHQPPSRAKIARLGRSVVAGDTHRLSIEYVTEYADGEPVDLALVQAGTLARRREGLGFADSPDWQQGFVTVAVAADGSCSYELARWDGRALTWRGERWS